VPIRHNFRFRLPNRPPCASRAPGPPGPQLAPSPIFHNSLLPLAGGVLQVPPISRSYSAIFSFVRQPPSPRESQASGPPASQPASISHLPTPYYHQQMRSATSYRCRAQAALLFFDFFPVWPTLYTDLNYYLHIMCLHPYTYILHQYRALYLLFILLSVIYYYISIVLYKGNKKIYTLKSA
jgi:hypothetical protein